MDETPKPPKKPSKKPLAQFKVVKTDTTKKVQMPAPTKEQVEAVFMASKHVEWTPFAQSMGWDPIRSRTEYPSAIWIQKKKQILAIQQAESIAEMVWDHRGRWHKDVLNALNELPRANETMLGILKHRMNELIQTINEDVQQKRMAAQTGGIYKSSFAKIPTNELVALATGLSIVTQAHQKSLLIDQWSVKVAETFTDPKQFETAEQKAADTDWTISIIGGEKMNLSNIESLMHQYYDQKPVKELLEEAKKEMPGERTTDRPTVYDTTPEPEGEL